MRRRAVWLTVLAVVLSLLAGIGLVSADTQQLTDPTFENGTGWYYSGSVSRVANGHYRSATHAAYWTSTGTITSSVTLPPGTTTYGCYTSDGNAHTWTFSLTRLSDSFVRSFTHAGNGLGGATWAGYFATMTDGANDAWTFSASYATDWGYADDCTVQVTAPPTLTPYPTNTPYATNTPYPTDTPVPTYTPLATNTPYDTATPAPTYTPLPPLPTYTPIPTHTPYPTNTPYFTATPYDTSTPWPTYTPNPTYTPYPTFTPLPPLPTNTAYPTNTPYDTPTPYNTATPYETYTPVPSYPTLTPWPTDTPYPTLTPVPPYATNTPWPTLTPYQTLTPWPTYTTVPPYATYTTVPPYATYTPYPPYPTYTSVPPYATYTPNPTYTPRPTYTPVPGTPGPSPTRGARGGTIDISGIPLTTPAIGQQTGILLMMSWLLTALALTIGVALAVEIFHGLRRAYNEIFHGGVNTPQAEGPAVGAEDGAAGSDEPERRRKRRGVPSWVADAGERFKRTHDYGDVTGPAKPGDAPEKLGSEPPPPPEWHDWNE